MSMFFARYFNSDKAEQAAWFLAWFTLPLSLKLSGASLILLAAIILFRAVGKGFPPGLMQKRYLAAPVILFLWYARELIWARPLLPAWKETEQMLSMVLIPLLFLFTHMGKGAFIRMAVSGLATALVTGSFLMLGTALLRFSQSGDVSEFTYHTLAKPLHTGAIYFSFYILYLLFILGDPALREWPSWLGRTLAVFLFMMLMLLASRMMIGLGLPLLAWHYRKRLRSETQSVKWMVIAGTLGLLAGLWPFLKRAVPLFHSNLAVVRAADFKGMDEPNGLTLRLILWRFGGEILQEEHAWFSGTGMVRSQVLLDREITRHGMYTGTGIGADRGYLGYNFHNQFIETVVRAGIPGLLILITILVIFAIQPQENIVSPKLFMVLTAGFFLTESVLERQAGIVFFCMIYSACFINNHACDAVNDRND